MVRVLHRGCGTVPLLGVSTYHNDPPTYNDIYGAACHNNVDNNEAEVGEALGEQDGEGNMRHLIAEVGSCKGDLGYALDAVDQFADVGVWAIKGQLYRSDTLVAPGTATYGKGLEEPATQHEAFANALSYDEWGVVAEHCQERGVEFFGSVFDFAAVDAAVEQGWRYIKIASADITYRALLERAAETGIHIILSTGAATPAEIEAAYGWLSGAAVTLLACTLAYPTPLKDANVDRVGTLSYVMARHGGGLAGYSDHTRGIVAADYAFRLGASMVEKHVTLTPGAGGDHNFGVTPSAVKELLGGWVSNDLDSLVAGSAEIGPSEVESAARRLARRSVHATATIKPGGTYTVENTAIVRPATGIPPAQWDAVLGHTAAREVPRGQPVVWDDIVR